VQFRRDPQPAVPDDPSTVRVIVFMRDQSGTELWVNFDTEADGRSGSTIGATGNVVVACEVVPAGGSVAVAAVPGLAIRLPLYTARRGDPDRVLWVDNGTGGAL
jgi:hypothetical protein